jgi:predicted alpha/beta superfamily hydrolase
VISLARMSEYLLYLLGPFRVRKLGQKRFARVYVPSGAPARGARILYLFDGQNVFHDAPSFSGGWYVHHSVEAMGQAAPIVVGLDHGGQARLHELSPFRAADSDGRLDELLDWMERRLMPMVARRWKVSTRPEDVAIGGSSMGGLASLYAHLTRPHRFGAALAMSPSLWFGDGRLLELATRASRPQQTRIYVDGGAREDGGSVARNVEHLGRVLRERGWTDEALRCVVDPNGEHCERDWRRRLPEALRFIATRPSVAPEQPAQQSA